MKQRLTFLSLLTWLVSTVHPFSFLTSQRRHGWLPATRKYHNSFILRQQSSTNSVANFTTTESRAPRTSLQLEENPSDSTATLNGNKHETDEILENSGRRNYEMPWSELQDWALRDKVPRYAIQVPIVGGECVQEFVLWRSVWNDVPELSGYPIDFLHQRYVEYQDERNADTTTTTTTRMPLYRQQKIPYYLDDFQFESNGGLTGTIYGIPGVADGTRITTKPVQNVEQTLPGRYVVTSSNADRPDDSFFVYELGRPFQSGDAVDSFVDVARKNPTISVINAATKNVQTQLSNAATNPSSLVGNDDGKDLLYLGGLSAILLGGAYASQVLSHHLTVNVFWV